MPKSFMVLVQAILLMAGVAGCQPAEPAVELGKVKGKLTINGAPGAEIDVIFEPQGAGKGVGTPSQGRTDAGGNYELAFGGDSTKKGAVIGSHTVRLIPAGGGGAAGGAAAVKQTVVIPPEYSTQSNMIKEVKKGDQTIDISIDIKK